MPLCLPAHFKVSVLRLLNELQPKTYLKEASRLIRVFLLMSQNSCHYGHVLLSRPKKRAQVKILIPAEPDTFGVGINDKQLLDQSVSLQWFYIINCDMTAIDVYFGLYTFLSELYSQYERSTHTAL